MSFNYLASIKDDADSFRIQNMSKDFLCKSYFQCKINSIQNNWKQGWISVFHNELVAWTSMGVFLQEDEKTVSWKWQGELKCGKRVFPLERALHEAESLKGEAWLCFNKKTEEISKRRMRIWEVCNHRKGSSSGFRGNLLESGKQWELRMGVKRHRAFWKCECGRGWSEDPRLPIFGRWPSVTEIRDTWI